MQFGCRGWGSSSILKKNSTNAITNWNSLFKWLTKTTKPGWIWQYPNRSGLWRKQMKTLWGERRRELNTTCSQWCSHPDHMPVVAFSSLDIVIRTRQKHQLAQPSPPTIAGNRPSRSIDGDRKYKGVTTIPCLWLGCCCRREEDNFADPNRPPPPTTLHFFITLGWCKHIVSSFVKSSWGVDYSVIQMLLFQLCLRN
jgi:hypothetical protein